jgi:5-methylcytosine-specific restriction endonuclease McrA
VEALVSLTLRRATTQHKHKENKEEEKNDTVSRTSTREHRQFRKQVLARAQAMGITHCPACGVKLQYNNNGGRKPNSAEADHIIPASLGGTNHPDNGRVLCAKCNSRRGNGRGGKGRARHYQKNEEERDRLPIAVMPTEHTDTW